MIQEANVDFIQASVREKYTAIFKEHFGQERVITATSCIAARSYGNLVEWSWLFSGLGPNMSQKSPGMTLAGGSP
jgi:hypothetical protein